MALAKELQRQLTLLEFGTVEITPRQEFVAMLEHSLQTQTPLRVKCGIDPTRTDIHLGHLLPYRKMRTFQDLGHTGVVVIGDYTARIGDPTGRDESRQSLSPEQVAQNCQFYERQLLRVLDPKRTEFRYQSQWFQAVDLQQVFVLGRPNHGGQAALPRDLWAATSTGTEPGTARTLLPRAPGNGLRGNPSGRRTRGQRPKV